MTEDDEKRERVRKATDGKHKFEEGDRVRRINVASDVVATIQSVTEAGYAFAVYNDGSAVTINPHGNDGITDFERVPETVTLELYRIGERWRDSHIGNQFALLESAGCLSSRWELVTNATINDKGQIEVEP